MIAVPEFDNITAAFGAPRSAFVTDREGSELERKFKREADVAQSLFFNGGKLTQYGLRLKPEIDSAKAHKALRALLCSFGPSHEAKIGTVARYLHEWCEACEPIADEPKASTPSKKGVVRASHKWRKKK